MKFFSLLFNLLLVSVALPCLTSGAQAAEEGNARFRYAKNTYAEEQSHQRSSRKFGDSLPHIRQGDVPRSSSFLDPGMLVSQSQPQVPPTVNTLMPPAFNKAFGRPAALPAALPATAMSGPMPKPAVARSSSSRVSGKVRPRRAEAASIARASSLPVAHSYAVGYQPGNTLPRSGSNIDFSVKVKGQVLEPKP